MTQDEIIRMFHEAGELAGWKPGVGNPLVINYLTHFAALVAAHEREKQAEQEPVAWMDLHKELGQLRWAGKDIGWDLAIDAVRNRLEELYAAPVQQVEQEPVAKVTDVFPTRIEWLKEATLNQYLYATPARTKDLTDDEIASICADLPFDENFDITVARAVIAADREKNRV